MALVAATPRGYTVDVSELAPVLPSTATPALDSAAAAAPLPTPTVWVLADDFSAATVWCDALRAEGLAVSCGDDEPIAARAVALYCRQRPSERLGLLRELRSRDPGRALIVACEELRELDQVLALEMGADDVVDARWSAPVVAARLRALWRRGNPMPASTPDHLSFGRLSLHLRERRVQLGGERIPLTECEFEVLWLLALQAGRAVSRAELLERLRGLPYQRIDRSIDCRIYRIRAKLHDGAGAAQRIRTVRNCGYLFSPGRW